MMSAHVFGYVFLELTDEMEMGSEAQSGPHHVLMGGSESSFNIG